MPRKSKKNDALEILAASTLRKEARELEEAERKERARQVAIRQMHQTEKDKADKEARFQGICDHLLGNHRVGVVPTIKRCALHKDYLSDKSVRIYCGKCRFEWRPGDTAEKVFRMQGELGRMAIANPTRKSWREINQYFYSFENSNDLTSRAFRIERVEPEDIDSEESRVLREQQIPGV